MRSFDDCLAEAKIRDKQEELERARKGRTAHKRRPYIIPFLLLLAVIIAVLCHANTDAAEPTSFSADEEQGIADTRICFEDVIVTHYCICEKCCGKLPTHPAYGITASGRKAEAGTSIAVDPALIPLGSTVEVVYEDEKRALYRADDTGCAIEGKHIDICCESHSEALNAGVATATVYIEEDAK